MMIISDRYASTMKTLKLDSALGNHIDNGQLSEIAPHEYGSFRQLQEKWNDGLGKRSEPTPRYNCHGMTFAARRTCVFGREIIEKILSDDGYILIDVSSVLPGDVILYFSEDGDVQHSGITISGVEQPFGIPKIISKWGKYKEIIHWANQCPYTFFNVKYYRVSA